MALRAALRSKCSVSGLLSQQSSCSSHGRLCRSPVPVAQRRNNSTKPKVKVDFDQSIGVALMRLQSPPVNSLSLDFLTEFCSAMDKMEMDESCRGLIIASRQPRVFSAGLDFTELYRKSPEYCGEFWKALQEMWLKLYSSNMVTMAAINGSSTAGGCLMSIACDYRIMADDPCYNIGFNKTQLGILAPFWVRDTMTNTVGQLTAERVLHLGLLYKPSKALQIGLVDLLVPEENILTTAVEKMTKWVEIPDPARQEIKSKIRKPTIDKLLSNREADIQHFVNFITKDCSENAQHGSEDA